MPQRVHEDSQSLEGASSSVHPARPGSVAAASPKDTRQSPASLPRRWLPSDPGLSGLRQATRAAVVIPATFAFAKLVIGDVQFVTFAVFGSFALLVIANFGGPRPPRAAAYAGATLAGVALITVGTLAYPSVGWAVLAMLLVGFLVQFSGVFGGYIAASQTALLLCFVLAVSIPAPAGAIGARVEGWLLAGAVSTLAGVFFWPRFERLALRSKAAEACRALAALFQAQHAKLDPDEVRRLQEATLQAVVAVRRRYKSTPKRPAGPARRDRAFVQLLTELERVWDFATRPFGLQQSTIHPCTGEGSALSNAVVQTFNASAEVLTGGRPPDLRSLVQARAAHRDALDRWASESMCIGVAAEDVLAGLDVDHRLRLVSYLTLAIGTNAIIASGREMDREVLAPAGTPYEGGVQVALHRIKKTIRTHLAPSSGVLHHSLRVAIGLGVAVLLARVLQIDHAFWVVLGTLSVLRSNAFNTGRSTIEALIGSIAGFAVGALFTVLAGPTSAAVWIALPLVVFIATYSSSAIGFVVSQAAFTMLVIMLFNLISPVGWRLGLVRIEDVAIGAGISLVASAFLWPRGARGELARAVAGQYRGVAAYLGDAFARVLDPASVEDLRWSRQRAVQAGDRAGEAFDRFLNERGARPLDPETGAFLIAAGSHGIIAGDLLNLIAGMGYRVRKDGNGVRAVNAQVHRLLNGFDGLAEQLEGKPGANDGQIALSDDALREAALTGLRDWQHDPESGRAAMAIVMASEWTQELGGLTHDLQKPVAQAVKAAQMPWWR